MEISEDQRFTETEFRKLSAGQRDHYATLTGQARIDYVATVRSGRVAPSSRQSRTSQMRDYGKVGTIFMGILMVIGVLAMVTSDSHPLAVYLVLFAAGLFSISSFAWMLGALEARIITLTEVLRSGPQSAG